MWPWGHAAFGYLLYSLGRRLGRRGPPADRPVVVLLVATLVPDLVDKPLSWGLGVFPSGYAVGHSVLVAVPVGLAVLGGGVLRGWPREGAAFAVGYWSHLLGDVLVASVRDGELVVRILLWPLVTLPPYGTDYGALERASVYFHEFVTMLASGDLSLGLVVLYFAPFGLAVLLWVLDGRPGPAALDPRRSARHPGN